jgi:putative hydrolase of the HAD superfamily
MTSTAKAVLFDLDGTLFDRDASFRQLVHVQYEAFSAALEGVPCEAFVRRVVELDEHGYVDKAVVYRNFASEFDLPQTLAERLTAHFQDTYASFSRCFPEVPSALADLRTHGLKLGIITNGATRMQEDKIRYLGIMDLVDDVFVSEREGLRKPDRRIFERALERLGVEATNAWYVGDHPVVDIRGASDAGLTAVWRRTSYWKEPGVSCHQISSLDDLLPLLF